MKAQTNMMKKIGIGLLAAAALAVGPACEPLDSSDLNNPSLESLTRNPTRAGVLAASTGLVIGHRIQVAQTNGFVSLMGILGRESYCFDKADPRFITEMLEAPALDSSSPAFGGNAWQQPYQNIRNAWNVRDALEGTKLSDDPVGGITPEERAAIRGFAMTMQAMDFMIIHNTRWTNGGPIDVNIDPSATPAPLKTKEEILTHVATLLDNAATQLAAGGDTFPFRLGTGFNGFDTPATFLQFNRGLRARVAVYQQQWGAALTALSASFLDDTLSDPVSDLAAGVYHAYGTGSGDVVNNLVSPNILAHPKLITEAEEISPGVKDLRVQRKLRQLLDENGDPTTTTSRGLTTGYAFSIYPSNTSPVPILKNEDLILLRAEARFNSGDLPGAEADINLIRVNSGGLAPVTVTAGNFVDELLKQRRYSMMFEIGQRWIDLRRYNRLNDPALKDIATHNVHVAFPIPQAECLARPNDPTVVGKCL